ncbi:hypothetical protein SKAU_G00122280 [Synaphobranchus kaupii]|uniref:Uncharacterized protein n=1 Tax=Synaphobranchus kaupii TaxID=118154 RepID=A0A9Q1FNX5_SYNKA|nr:hypothetical protein SKAU_G00122280 [Synaphobranchus kaupii]
MWAARRSVDANAPGPRRPRRRKERRRRDAEPFPVSNKHRMRCGQRRSLCGPLWLETGSALSSPQSASSRSVVGPRPPELWLGLPRPPLSPRARGAAPLAHAYTPRQPLSLRQPGLRFLRYASETEKKREDLAWRASP